MDQFVFALHHFTGSKDHNVQMRQRALARGLSLSEWGLVPAEGEGTAKEKAELKGAASRVRRWRMRSSSSRALGSVRSSRRNCARASVRSRPRKSGPLPRLVELAMTCGEHFTTTRPRPTAATRSAEMTRRQRRWGWEYLGIADHSKSSFQARV
jgi:DNA polymerase (family 10)